MLCEDVFFMRKKNSIFRLYTCKNCSILKLCKQISFGQVIVGSNKKTVKIRVRMEYNKFLSYYTETPKVGDFECVV